MGMKRFLAVALFLTAMYEGQTAAAATKKKSTKKPGADTLVVFDTNKGQIVIRLFADKAPVSARNMLAYVQTHFYDGLIFHRVIPDFMMQGGGFDQNLVERATRTSIKNEADNGLPNRRGTVAMARTSAVDSATSQFFINFKDNAALDHTPQSFGYAVVGEVVDGMGVVESIRHVPTRCPSWTGELCSEHLPPGMMDVPKDPVVILRAYRKG